MANNKAIELAKRLLASDQSEAPEYNQVNDAMLENILDHQKMIQEETWDSYETAQFY